ncbi:hypothetical protein, partial [Haloferax volcanii]|uniref:hypothetical protein n=1 Tax=Haloferax volcanii TaxID=2246 RepID=UPI0019D3B88B
MTDKVVDKSGDTAGGSSSGTASRVPRPASGDPDSVVARRDGSLAVDHLERLDEVVEVGGLRRQHLGLVREVADGLGLLLCCLLYTSLM